MRAHVVACLASAVTAAVLAGCGGTSSSSGSSAAGSTGASGATAQTCAEQFATWQNGPAKAVAKQIVPDLNKVSADAKIEDIPSMNTDLKNAGQIAQQLVAYPMPSCADPAGYWTQLLGYLKAAGDNAGSSSGLAGLLTAMAPLEKIPAVETSLQAELAKNAGLKGKVLGS